MDTKDLKRGNNLRRNSTGEIITVEEVLTNSISFINPILSKTKLSVAYIDGFSGIELTPDVLLNNLECIQKGNNFYIGHIECYFVLTRDWREHISYHFGIQYTDSPFPEDDGKVYNFSFEVRYVHQLQNLYYFITGEELIFKIK